MIASTNQEVAWTEEMCDDILSVKAAIDKLKDNENFQIFRKFYIEKQRVDLCRELGTHKLAEGPNRQLAIEALIAIDNFEFFLDNRLEQLASKADYFKENFKKGNKKDS